MAAGIAAGILAIALVATSGGNGSLGSSSIGVIGGSGGGTATGAAFTGPVAYNCEALTYAATVNIDFSTNPCKTLTVAGGDLTLTTSNLAAGRVVTVFVTGDSSERTLTIPVWSFTDGVTPASVSATVLTRFDLFSRGTTNASVVADISQSTSAITSNARSLFLGVESGVKAGASATANTYVGNRTGHENVSGQENTCVGQGCCYQNTGTGNVALGYHGMLDPTGTNSVCIGDAACEGASAADVISQDVFIGFQAGRGAAGLTSANDNVGVGYQSLAGLTTGDANVGIATAAGDSITTGANNLAIGKNALTAQVTNDNSIAIGVSSLTASTADQNVSIGVSSLISATSAANNVCVGFQCGFGVDGTNKLTTGSGNTMVGFEATVNATGAANRMALGNGAVSLSDNNVQLGNTSATTFTLGSSIFHTNAPTSVTSGSCTSETLRAGGTEHSGEVTATCTAQTWIVAFTTTYGRAPICTVVPMNAAAAADVGTVYTTATTGLTVTVTTATTTGIWSYSCIE